MKATKLIKRFAHDPKACFVCGYVIHKETYWSAGTRAIHKDCLEKYNTEEE